MLLNKGPVPNSMGLNPQSTQQYAQPMKNTLTNPATWAKGLRRFGLPLSLLLNTNEAQAAELPGFQDKLQQGLLTMPHEQQQATPQEHEMRDARQSLGSSFTEQEAMRPLQPTEQASGQDMSEALAKIYKLRNNKTGEIVKLEGPEGASKEELVRIYQKLLKRAPKMSPKEQS